MIKTIAALNKQIDQIKSEKIAIKKQSFEDFIVSHFGRALQAGDVIETDLYTNDGTTRQFSVVESKYYGQFELICHAIKNGQVLDTLEKAHVFGCNEAYVFSKTQLKYFKFKLV